ncbi:MAG: GguC family protein [Gammaproteobacteria bacterium]|nr:FAH family protein [Gammaproteobacteria bacterium]
MRLIQYVDDRGALRVGRIEGDRVLQVAGFDSMYELALQAIARGTTLEALVEASATASEESYEELRRSLRVRPPLTHPDAAHCLVSGTGLTHLGSAETRDAMHKKLSGSAGDLTDSMRLFKLGLEGGKPAPGEVGVQPEWFYKGDGSVLVNPGAPLTRPAFALDGGEEPELVGLYVIGPDAVPYRLGFALGNEFSDHVMERQNYLYLAHSKLRQCAVGPELRTGPLPPHLEGRSRIRRGAEVVWEKPFFTGEANMCHSLANLEYHHFKYSEHRRPLDVHLHFFGTATLSFADSVRVQPGDVFEIELAEFGAPLTNTLRAGDDTFTVGQVRAL